MKKKIASILIVAMIVSALASTNVFAARLDPAIPTNFTGLSLNTDGTATFTPPDYTVDVVIGGVPASVSQWKKFEAKLLKRQSVVSGGATTYQYTETGQIKSCDADEREIELKFSSTGYYQFEIRGVNLEGNYGAWVKIDTDPTYEGLPISEDDISIDNGGSSSGSGSGYGPGTVTTGTLPTGYQYAIIGPNGEILGYTGNNTSNGMYNGMAYYQQGSSQYYGPGYAANGNQNGMVVTPNTGISNYQQVESPYAYSGMTNNQSQLYTNPQTNGQANAQVNPNYYNGQSSTGYGSTTNQYAQPQITQGLEIGWHVDNNGRFYYQGNGVVLKSTWYLIDGAYYRFADNGYLLANQWFKDNNTGYWYFLAGDGRMLTGWQCLNGVWYYFKPQNGNGYGTMYANTAFYIEDQQWGSGYYAFDANGAMVKNAWYGGYYYNNDGRRAN